MRNNESNNTVRPFQTGADESRRVRVTVEKVFRGRQYPKPVEIFSASYKADYQLISKHEEKEFCKVTPTRTEKILPSTIEMPPLLREFVERETSVQNPSIPMKLKNTKEKFYRLAKEGERPTIDVGMGLVKSLNDQLLGSVQAHK